MSIISRSLTFTDNEIFYIESSQKFSVMMDWEDNIMSASAAYACENGGDILEIGFGMAISAGYIQSHSIQSHTICENHPDIIPKAMEWASSRPNVTIVSQSWYDALKELGKYDGIFYDPYEDDNYQDFSSSLTSLSNPGCNVTWWNNTGGSNNLYNINKGVTYEIINCTPPTNDYYKESKYYLPKL